MAVLNLIGFLAEWECNALAIAVSPGGKTTGQLSDKAVIIVSAIGVCILTLSVLVQIIRRKVYR